MRRSGRLPALRRLVRPGPALLAVVALGLVARLWALGWRVAHQDEARVAHWILQYVETGTWSYRPIIHGPFLPHVNGVVFSVLGPSDFTARLVVAVIGAALPLVAWLLREHLRDAEVVALGVLLAANPVLLYYSRFMRNDVPLVALMLFTVGFVVRARDTGKARYLYAAALAFGLAFTTKENALVYPVAWLGALALVVDHRLFLARTGRADWIAVLWTHVARTLRGLWAWKLPIAVAVVEFFAVVVGFYAPKPDLWAALANPARLPGVVDEATFGTWRTFADTWFNTDLQGHAYLPFLGSYLKDLAYGALVVSVLAVGGFLVDRYGNGEPRPLVSFAFYWGFASVLGYPLIVDIRSAWSTVHAVGPLAIPAAVALGLILRHGWAAVTDGDEVAAAAAAVLVLFAGGISGVAAADQVYERPQGPENELVQYAQAAGEMQPAIERVRRVAAENDGVDVVFYGDEFYFAGQDCSGATAPGFDGPAAGAGGEAGSPAGGVAPIRACGAIRPSDPGWFGRLPLPWYFERHGATTASENESRTFAETEPLPPVVVALGPGQGEHTSADVEAHLDGYDKLVYEQYQHSRPLVVYVRSDAGTGDG